jgi:molybdenum cofactor cytidylyltransferase
VTAAIVLAAGASTRLGEPKQLVELGSETLLERAVRTARDAGCAPIVVVLGANSEQILERSNLGDAVVVLNETWDEGMASSIRVGIGAVAGADSVLLMTCDQPAATADHLRKLTASSEITASAYAARRGVPAYFPASTFPALMQLRGDAGARELLRDATAIELPGGELDVDTLPDLVQARDRFR